MVKPLAAEPAKGATTVPRTTATATTLVPMTTKVGVIIFMAALAPPSS